MMEIRNELERLGRMVGKILAAPYKMANNRLHTAMNELLYQDYDSAFESLSKVIDLADKAFHHIADTNLDKESFRDITRVLKMAAFAKILKYSYDKDKKIFCPYFTLGQRQQKLISAELESLGKDGMKIVLFVTVDFIMIKLFAAWNKRKISAHPHPYGFLGGRKMLQKFKISVTT